MKNFEHKFADCKKDKNGYTKICIRLYGNAEYICVMAKPIPLTRDEMTECGGFDEVLRLNLTKFDIQNIPGTEKLYGKIDSESIMYYNGAERAWKFYDEPNFSIDDGNLSEAQIEMLANEKPWFEPHNDEAGNYGDVDDHSTYSIEDLLTIAYVKKIKKPSKSKKTTNYDKLIGLTIHLQNIADYLKNDIDYAKHAHKAMLFKKDHVKELRKCFDQIVCDTDTDEAI